MNLKHMRPLTCAVVLFAAAPVALPRPVHADEPEAMEFLPRLTALWWQDMLSIPTVANPLLDDTGDNCPVGQRGDIWFLAGTFSSTGVAKRKCTIPSSKSLLVPGITFANYNSPGRCGQTDPLTAVEERVALDNIVKLVTSASITVDGKVVWPLRRVRSTVFEVTLPPRNSQNAACGFPNAVKDVVPAGVYYPTVADGYWALIPPLSPGKHTLLIRSAIESFQFKQEIDYTLTIVETRK